MIKQNKTIMTKNQMVEAGFIEEDVVNKIEEAINNGESILITGGTGSGKTTLLNSLGGLIPSEDRIALVKDSSNELDFDGRDNLAHFEDDIEGAIKTMPDYVISDELRDDECNIFMKVLNIGISGMATIHSHSVDYILEALYMSISSTDDHVEKLELIKNAFDIVVVTGMTKENDESVRKVVEVKRISKDLIEVDGTKFLDTFVI